jgi:hypothetical protein
MGLLVGYCTMWETITGSRVQQIPDTLSGAILEAALVLPHGGGKLVDLQK